MSITIEPRLTSSTRSRTTTIGWRIAIIAGVTAITTLGTLQPALAGGTDATLAITGGVLARSAAAGSGWVVSVISTAFTPPSGPAIPASAVGYTAGEIVQTGTANDTANDLTNLTGVSPAVTATGITSDKSATWNPTTNIAVPGGMAANVYSAPSPTRSCDHMGFVRSSSPPGLRSCVDQGRLRYDR